MWNSHKSLSTRLRYVFAYDQHYLETDLRASFLPLEEHTVFSFTLALEEENAPFALMPKFLHLFNGMKACQKQVSFYQKQRGRAGQMQAYRRTANMLEAELRLLLFDTFPPK